jgi:hypothetical protein
MSQEIFYNKTINKKELKSIVNSTFQVYGMVKATQIAEALKKSGFSFATQAGISISIEDLKVPPTKDGLFLKNNKQINSAYYDEKRATINEVERFQKVIDTWHTTSELLKTQLVDYFKAVDPLNPVYMMAFSGARGNLSQVRQLVGMRGLMSDPNGQIIDLPIKTNFREGLSITDYIISSYGARKGIVDTALRTADSGYLTRRLVDVAQHVIIRELDCQTKNGIRVLYDPTGEGNSRYRGRVLAKAVVSKNSANPLLERNTTLTKTTLLKIDFQTDLVLRSPLICESSKSICQKCYGWNLSQCQLVELADAVGVIAAQSIGEPGTQLTMRTFHTGGVFTGSSSNQLRSRFNGQILFSPNLKVVASRTMYGELILKSENRSEVFVWNSLNRFLKRVAVTPGMLLFTRNKGFIKSGDLIAELPSLTKRTTNQIKTIFTSLSGEVQFQNLIVDKNNNLTNNGLIWVANGQIYDLSKNMRVKLSGEIVVKNNVFAQTKIINPIGGMVKYNASKMVESIVDCVGLFPLKQFYQTLAQQPFLLVKSNRVFILGHMRNDELPLDKVFANRLTNIYILQTPHQIFYSRTSVNASRKCSNFTICLLCPQVKASDRPLNINSPIWPIWIIDRVDVDCDLGNRIVYPGELICSRIEVTCLSYCTVEEFDEVSVIFTILPLKQCAIPNPKQFLQHFNSTIIAKHSTSLNAQNIFKYVNSAVIPANVSFLDTCFEFKEGYTKIISKPILLERLGNDFLSFFGSIKLPSNKNIAKSKHFLVSYCVTHNQIVTPYTVIAKFNSIANEKLHINNIKNREVLPERFLVSIPDNYKTFDIKGAVRPEEIKFILAGDKLGNNFVSDYSGFVVETKSSNSLKIRLATPIFVSIGTRILIEHSRLINQAESFCQLVYTRTVSDDIVTGLPRIEQLLEGRIEKTPCQLIENPGLVKSKSDTHVTIIEKREVRTYLNQDTVAIVIKKGDLVSVAQPLDARLVSPHQVLEVYFKHYCSMYALENATKRSVTNIQILLLNLVQGVYNSQGIYISNKHVEVIVRQMTTKAKILQSSSETTFVSGEMIELEKVFYINRALQSTQQSIINYQPVLLGITKVSLMTESFISAASFQETTRILTRAAIEGKVEWLRGLKENVILGRLIPAGTGFKAFSSLSMLNICLH